MPARNSHTWYSWSSPIGLGLFLIGLSLAFLVVTMAVITLARTGTVGLDVAERGLRLERMMDGRNWRDSESFELMMPAGQQMMQ